MPEKTKTQAPKSKQIQKPRVEQADPELASEPPVEMDGLANDIARQLAGQPPAPQSSRSRPKFTTRQVNQLQRKVGNQATRRMLTAAGRGRIQREPIKKEHEAAAKEAANREAEAAKNKPNTDKFDGYTLTPDPSSCEAVINAIMVAKGFKGVEEFIERYSNRVIHDDALRLTRNDIKAVLQSKFSEMQAKGKTFAENQFKSAAEATLETILKDSLVTVEAEEKKYGLGTVVKKGGTYHGEQLEYGEKVLTNQVNLAEMSAAAKDLVNRQAKMDELNRKLSSLETVTVTKPPVDYEVSKYFPPQKTEITRTPTDPVAHRQVLEEMKQTQRDFDMARMAAEAKFPILASFQPPYSIEQLKTLAEGSSTDRNNLVIKDLQEKRKNISEIKEVIYDGKFIFTHDSILNSAKRMLAVVPNSVEDCGIDAKRQQIEKSELYTKLGLGLVSLIAGALLAIPTGGSSLVGAFTAGVGAGALAGASAITLYKGVREYQIEKAAAGTNFDKAKAISQQDPSLFWLALDIIGAVTDLGAAAKVFIRASTAIRAAGEIKNAEEAAEVIIQNGNLGGVYKKEQLAQRLGQNLPSTSAAKTSAKRGLDVLSDAAHPTTKALMAGDPGAIRNLVKSYGKWEGLLAELEAGSPEMKQIAAKINAYRQEKFMKPLEEAGFKTQGGSSEHVTSDIDVYSTSDEKMGAGAKLIEKEKQLTAEWGSASWDVDLRITFYTDLKSRLLVADELIDMQLLSEAEKAAILIEQSKLSTKYNMARRLQTAVGNPELIAQIEKDAVEAGVENLDEVRKLAAQGEDVALRNQALLEADDWEAKFTKAKETYKADKSEANKQAVKEYGLNLQRAQMRANFYTKEAVLSPGTAYDVLKLPRQAQGLQVADAILEWTAIMEHKIAEYGSVTKALREYEPWKYMDRIAAQAQKAQIDETLMVRLNFLKDRASRIVPAEVRSEQWVKEAEHLGGYAKMDAGNMRVYQQFKGDMGKIAADIRASEMKKLEAAAPTPTP